MAGRTARLRFLGLLERGGNLVYGPLLQSAGCALYVEAKGGEESGERIRLRGRLQVRGTLVQDEFSPEELGLAIGRGSPVNFVGIKDRKAAESYLAKFERR